MSTPQEQYLDAMNAAADSWAKAAQQFFQATPQTSFPVSSVDPSEVIDQVFDFAEQFLSAQRQFAKSLATASSNVADTMRSQAETFQNTVTEATERNLAAAKDLVDTSSSISAGVAEAAQSNVEAVVEDAAKTAQAAEAQTEQVVEEAAEAAAEAPKSTTRAPRKTAARKAPARKAPAKKA